MSKCGQHLLAMPDKFRGTATAAEAGEAMRRAAQAVGWACEVIPIADGGEGLLECFGGPNTFTEVTGPLGDPVTAGWRLDGKTAVIEMSAASGMALVGARNRPMDATTRGTGQLVVAALQAGAREVVVGAGGSATTDGGDGAVDELAPYAPLDGSRGYKVSVAVDVETRFVDAAAVFGPQKGATPDQVRLLTKRLQALAASYRERFGHDITTLSGGGAAGGLAGGLAAVGASLSPGFALVAEHLQLEQRIRSADLVMSGEGKLDRSSLMGKGPVALTRLCEANGVPAVLIVGTREPGLTWDFPTVALDESFGAQAALTDTLRCIEKAASEVLGASTPPVPDR